MIALLHHIILCVTAASLFCAVALSLVPDGSIKEVIRMGSGMVLILSLAIPLRQSIPKRIQDILPQFEAAELQDTEQLYQEAMLHQVEIETAQYVVRQAGEYDIHCTASVSAEADANGRLYITAVEIMTDEGKETMINQLRQQLSEELGINDDNIIIR